MARELLHTPGVAGCDEAGRGPLAGPVVCAAVVLPEGFCADGLDDSKKLPPARRLEWEARITEAADWAVVSVGPEEIDALNILWASLDGMARALAQLVHVPARAIIDGDRVPRSVPCPCSAAVRGDGTYACVAAASVLAKCARDRLMAELHEAYPQYGWDRNFGYPTPDHLAALREHGPSPVHRRSFAPVAEALAQPALGLW